MRRHVRSPSGMFEAHLFNEVSPRELRDLQTGLSHTHTHRSHTCAQTHTLSPLCVSAGGGEGVQVWPIQEADGVS